ncbi:hypothetical protein WN51_04230 [Melipona quadrifasciata]|uniref:Uncharacterized protein n=1 Tax=Melipona quadrifasciata TaxID=166423 RepID=A0A0M8ZUG6_9HYME|nr:hypothetical protein WN51_04230 [Melipona quadrifasciata]
MTWALPTWVSEDVQRACNGMKKTGKKRKEKLSAREASKRVLEGPLWRGYPCQRERT